MKPPKLTGKQVEEMFDRFRAIDKQLDEEYEGPCQFLSVNPPPTPEVGFRIAVT